MSLPLVHEAHGRSRTALMVLAGVYGVLGGLILWVDLSIWIAAALALFTLPALWEFVTNPVSNFRLDAHNMTWSTPTVNDELAVALIMRVRFDTRLDLSVKVTVFLKDGRKLRLPHACTPPHMELEEAFKALGIHTERHHFSLIG